MRQRKKKRKQIYTELWGMDTEQLRWHLNVFGVDGVAAILDCDRTTVWRATRANGLKRAGGMPSSRPTPTTQTRLMLT